METGSLVKILWAIFIVIIFVANNFKRKKQAPQQEFEGDDSHENEPRSFDLETIFREELKRHTQTMTIEDEPKPTKRESPSRVVTPQSTPTSKMERVAVSTAKSNVSNVSNVSNESKSNVSNVSNESKSNVSKSSIARNFDLRRAVIEAEILKPKIKNE